MAKNQPGKNYTNGLNINLDYSEKCQAVPKLRDVEVRSEQLGHFQEIIFLLFVAILPRKMARISTSIRAKEFFFVLLEINVSYSI